MKKEVVVVEKDDLLAIFSQVDDRNEVDFSTTKAALKDHVRGVDPTFYREFIAYLEDEFGFSCDAELVDITDEEIEDLLYFIEDYNLQ